MASIADKRLSSLGASPQHWHHETFPLKKEASAAPEGAAQRYTHAPPTKKNIYK